MTRHQVPANYLTRLGDTEAAAAAVSEARDIAGTLRCKPLLDQAATITSATITVHESRPGGRLPARE
jgi:hypothetical protein